MSRIVLVEEQTVARQALRQLMEAHGHEVVAEADNGLDALLQVRRFLPDLVVLELSLPRLGGLKLIQRLKSRENPVRILVLTAQDSEYFAARCLEAGATGFVSKHEDMAELEKALDAVLHGHGYFPSNVLGTAQGSADNPQGLALKNLSARELDVLRLLCQGLSNVAIGAQLALSDKTVGTYKIRLKEKLQASSQMELIDIARRQGLVEWEPVNPEAITAPLTNEQLAQLRLLNKVADALPYAVCVRDREGRLIACNAAYLAQRQLTLQDIQGRRMYETNELANEDAHLLHRELLAAAASGVAYSRDILIDFGDGSRVLRHWGSPYRDEHGQWLGMICGNVDITDLDDRLFELRATLQRSQAQMHARDEMLAELADALGAPLQRLRQHPGDTSALKPLLAAGQRLQHLLAAERDDLPLVPLPLQLRERLERYVRRRANDRVPPFPIELDLQALRHGHVWLDPTALIRLLDAALDYVSSLQPAAPCLISVRASGRSQGLVEVRLQVRAKDGNATMRPADNSATGAVSLALARALVEKMAGTLTTIPDEHGNPSCQISLMLGRVESP